MGYHDISPINLRLNTIYSLKVHVIDNQYMAYLNEQALFSSPMSFLPSYSGNYAGIYMYTNQSSSIATVATFHSFTVNYPNSNDNQDALLCTAYTFDTNNSECYGYFGNDYDVLKNSLFEDGDYESAILYNECSPTSDLSEYPTNNPTAEPSDSPIQSNAQKNVHTSDESHRGHNNPQWFFWLIIILILISLASLSLTFFLREKKKKNEMNKVIEIMMADLPSVSNDDDEDDQVKFITNKENKLLTEWKLGQYANILDDKGYEDVDDWKGLTLGDLKRFGFKEGHAKKFRRKTEEYFESQTMISVDKETYGNDEGGQTMDLINPNIANDEFIVDENTIDQNEETELNQAVETQFFFG